MANISTIEKRIQMFHLLCEGNGMRSIQRITGVSINTIPKFQTEIYKRILEYNKEFMNNLECREVQADELRTYINKKGVTDLYAENGTYWLYVALDTNSRVVIDFHLGKRDEVDAREFFRKVSARLTDSCKMSTDCLKSYISAVNNTSNDGFWSEREKINLARARIFGDKLGRAITNRIETHNGVIRQHCSRLQRRTRCISKKKDKLIEHLTLFFFYYNFIKIHKSIKMTPAMKAGLIQFPMTIQELVEVYEKGKLVA